MTINFFKAFSVGSHFHHENGDEYVILAMDEKKDKAVLFKKTECGTPYFVGAWCMHFSYWGQGHYFMEDGGAAFEWFNEKEKEEENDILVKQILDLLDLDEDEYEVKFYDVSVANWKTVVYYNTKSIPKEFLESKVFQIELHPKEINDIDFLPVVISIKLKSEHNPEIRKFFNF